MDPYLKELCMEFINHDINSEKFVSLWIGPGIKRESLEGHVANKILGRGDEINAHMKNVATSIQ